MKKAIFTGVNALGDTLCTTPVLRAFRKANPGTFLIYVVQNNTFCRVLDGNTDIDLLLYSEQLSREGAVPGGSSWLYSLPLDLDETATLFHFDIHQVCSRSEGFQKHISRGFSDLLDIPIHSIRPSVAIDEEERRLARTFVRRPYVILSMHSAANPERGDGKGLAKDWPEPYWLRLIEGLHALGDYDVIALGSEWDPRKDWPGLRNLYGLPVKISAALMEDALCVVSLENGMAHLAAAVDAPLVEIYSSIVPLDFAAPKEASRCRVLYGDPREITYDEVMEAVRHVSSVSS